MDRISWVYVFVFTITVLPFPSTFYYISGTEIGSTFIRFLAKASAFAFVQ